MAKKYVNQTEELIDKLGNNLKNSLHSIGSALWRDKGDIAEAVTSLDSTRLAGAMVIEAVGIPEYVEESELSGYAAYGLTRSGWYVFARIPANTGVTVTAETTVTGAEGVIKTIGGAYIDVAVRFEVAAQSQAVTVNWGDFTETYIFKATDLAVRNLDYRVTNYYYDLAPYATWEWKLTEDANFKANQNYYTKDGDVYTLAEVQTVQYNLTADATFQADKKYYTREGDVYTEATVTVGEAVTANTYYEASDVPVPADTYYVHAKLILSGMIKNVTYEFNEDVDCGITVVLPEIPDDGHGAWFEFHFYHTKAGSITMDPPADVKAATAGASASITAGINVVDLHYVTPKGKKTWSLANVHTNIPS